METKFPNEDNEIRFPMGVVDDEAKVMRNNQSSGTAFLQLSSMILSHRGVETILDFIVQESLNCLNAHRVSIFHMDEKNGILMAQFSQACQPEYTEVGLFEEKEMARNVFKEGKSFLLKEPKDFSKLFKYVKGERTITSLMTVPLSFQGKTIRAFSAVSINEVRTFDEKDLQSLLIFGNLASIAMEIVYLLAEVRKGASFRRTYEQYLDNIQNQLQDLGRNQKRHLEESFQRFLPRKEEGKSSDCTDYSNALSKTYDIPTISLKDFTINPSLQKAVGEKYALNHKILVLENSPDKIKLALAEPTKYILDELRRIIPPRKRVEFYLANPDEVKACFGKYLNPFSLTNFK
jgi:hypothetical protein